MLHSGDNTALEEQDAVWYDSLSRWDVGVYEIVGVACAGRLLPEISSNALRVNGNGGLLPLFDVCCHIPGSATHSLFLPCI
mmetsp:Transcript_9187/g.18696  ORF Transcript_9187/g.18696 Transcript_9187/m.18696 type:complete len:81 (+) Transcript_9187:1022-1264(+)